MGWDDLVLVGGVVVWDVCANWPVCMCFVCFMGCVLHYCMLVGSHEVCAN